MNGLTVASAIVLLYIFDIINRKNGFFVKEVNLPVWKHDLSLLDRVYFKF